MAEILLPKTTITEWEEFDVDGAKVYEACFTAQSVGFLMNLKTTYTILWDGTAYEVVGVLAYDGSCACFGNPGLLGGLETSDGSIFMGNGEPFNILLTEDNEYYISCCESGAHSIAIYQGTMPKPEEPTAPIGFIEYLVNPKYHMGNPFRGFIGWKLAQNAGGGGADGEPALVSSDGYTLQDVNGLNLIPKEGK